jgi:hypothetical protein
MVVNPGVYAIQASWFLGQGSSDAGRLVLGTPLYLSSVWCALSEDRALRFKCVRWDK